jgi:N,N'-diacetyllegionaminate synthase
MKIRFKVKKNYYESYKKILVIAEIGSNHDNNFSKCKKLILSAKKAGCDAVKFQLFKADKLVLKNSLQYNFLKKLELSEEWIKKISKFCKKNKILFACSPFYLDAVNLLKKYKCDIIKIASPEIKNLPLISLASRSGIPVIISTGDSSLKEILEAKKQISKSNYKKTAFLHCISEYPTKVQNLNLNNINYLNDKLKSFSIGFSDHSMGIDASINAVSIGAAIIEKHITLNRSSKGPDHFFAIEPLELNEMIFKINNFVKSYGNYNKKRLKDENTIFISMSNSRRLMKNESIKADDIFFARTLKQGLHSRYFKDIIKKRSKKIINEGAKLSKSYFI